MRYTFLQEDTTCRSEQELPAIVKIWPSPESDVSGNQSPSVVRGAVSPEGSNSTIARSTTTARITQGRPTCLVFSHTSARGKMKPMHKLRILILHPDPAGLALLTSMLKSLGHVIEEASNDRVAVRLMDRNNVDLVLAGVDPLDAEALDLLTYVRRKHREVPVILLFPRLHPDRAKEALRLGAMAVLKYPVPAAELRAAVLQALERSEARSSEPANLSIASNLTAPESRPSFSPASSEPALATVTRPATAHHAELDYHSDDGACDLTSLAPSGRPGRARYGPGRS